MPSNLLPANTFHLQRLIFTLFILMLSCVVGLYIYLNHQQIRHSENQKLVAQANVVAVNIEQHITSLDRVIEEILALRQFVNAEQLRDHIQSLVNAMPIIRSISIMDHQGRQIMGTRDQYNGTDFSKRPSFQNVLTDPQPLKLHVSAPYVSVRGDWIISLSKAEHDSNGRLQGAVVVTLDPIYLRNLMESTLYAPDMWAALRHVDYDTVIRVHGGIAGEHHDVQPGEIGLSEMPQTLQDGAPMVMDSHDGSSRQLVATSTIVSNSVVAALPLQAIMGRDYSVAMADWRRFAYLQVALLGLFIVTTTAALIFLQRRQQKYTERRAEYLQRIREDQQRIRARERDFRIIVERTPSCIIRLDENGNFSYVNPAFCALFGLTDQEAKGLSFYRLMTREDAESTRHLLRNALQQASEHQFRAECMTPHGRQHMEWALCALVGPENSLEGVIGIGHDVSAHISLHEELRTLAERDGLTGLYNRRHFVDAGNAQVAHAHRYEQDLSIILLDLDHFKKVNDTYGHHTGDLTLQACARLMQDVSRESDIPVRVGGEELAILLPSTALEGAALVAERLRSLIEQYPIELEDGDRLHVTASLSAAQLVEGDTLTSLMQRADTALYRAKQNGRNRVETAEN